MNKCIEEIATFLFQNHGLDVSMYEKGFLLRSLDKRLAATDTPSYKDYSIRLREDKAEIDLLAHSLHVAYSEFFRNPLTFSVMEQILLPLYLEKKKKSMDNEIRVWSAACASGQEPYSIAIVLDDVLTGLSNHFICRIFATDIDESGLSNARAGVYSTDMLNNVSLRRLQTYFIKQGETYAISPKLKNYIDYSIFDLLTEKEDSPPVSIYGNFDFIFCSNVLFYYNAEAQSYILDKLSRNLVKGGFLITGETERKIVKENKFREIFAGSGIFQKINQEQKRNTERFLFQ